MDSGEENESRAEQFSLAYRPRITSQTAVPAVETNSINVPEHVATTETAPTTSPSSTIRAYNTSTSPTESPTTTHSSASPRAELTIAVATHSTNPPSPPRTISNQAIEPPLPPPLPSSWGVNQPSCQQSPSPFPSAFTFRMNSILLPPSHPLSLSHYVTEHNPPGTVSNISVSNSRLWEQEGGRGVATNEQTGRPYEYPPPPNLPTNTNIAAGKKRKQRWNRPTAGQRKRAKARRAAGMNVDKYGNLVGEDEGLEGIKRVEYVHDYEFETDEGDGDMAKDGKDRYDKDGDDDNEGGAGAGAGVEVF